jgi:hypothetical protein
LLFWLSSVALVGVAVLLLSGLGGGGAARPQAAPPAPPRGGASVYGVRPVPARSPGAGPPAGLAGPAREFVDAFLRYEVGEADVSVRHALRASATAAFADELLEAPVAVPVTGVPRAAVVARLRMRRVVSRTPVALVSGEARRPGGVEQFSFVFVRTSSGWRARGPGE